METAARIIWWIMLIVLIITQFISNLAIIQISCIIGVIALRVYIVESVFRKLRFTDQEKDLIRFISNEFSKVVTDNKEYLISATISSDIINNTEIDGIIFPSVQLGGQAGLNIALSTKAVNSKLRFIRTIGHTLYKNRDKSLLRMEKITENKCKTKDFNQFNNQIILNELNIKSIKELPLIV